MSWSMKLSTAEYDALWSLVHLAQTYAQLFDHDGEHAGDIELAEEALNAAQPLNNGEYE